MPKPHSYSARDVDSLFTVEVPMRALAEQVEDLPHGAHRFLSHLIDVRRERLKARVADYQRRGDNDIAFSVLRQGDPLADGLEAMLNQGLM